MDEAPYKVVPLDELEYFWNEPQCKQIIGRAVRAKSIRCKEYEPHKHFTKSGQGRTFS